VKLRLISWTALAALCTALGVIAGCGGNGSDPFGSSGGGGGGGGGGGTGTLAMQVLSNNVAGYFGSVTVTVSPLVAGVVDPNFGDVSTYLDLSAGSAGLGAQFCPSSALPACSQPLLWPTFAAMNTWTLKFDLMVSATLPLVDIDTIAVSWGPAQCAQVCNISTANLIPGTFTPVVVAAGTFKTSGCTDPPANWYNNTAFGLTVMRSGTPAPGDGVSVDNVRWVH